MLYVKCMGFTRYPIKNVCYDLSEENLLDFFLNKVYILDIDEDQQTRT